MQARLHLRPDPREIAQFQFVKRLRQIAQARDRQSVGFLHVARNLRR